MASDKKYKLSAIEKEILQALSDGKTSYQIADQRKITASTLSTQLGNLRLKMGCNTTPQLIAECFRNGILN